MPLPLSALLFRSSLSSFLATGSALAGAAVGLALIAPLRLAAAPMSDDEKALWQAERGWYDAYVHNDPDAIAAHEAKDFVITRPDGHQYTRNDEIALARSGTRHLTRLENHEISLHRFADSAVITGRVVVEGTSNAQSYGVICAFTDVLVRQEGRWLVAASNAVPLATGTNLALVPLWRDGGWIKRHENFVALAPQSQDVDLLFVGDSITDFWRDRGKEQWTRFWGKYHAANLGISGDRTEHVLWRLQHGEVDGLSPKAIVLMIGTNNLGMERDGLTPRGSPSDAAAGVKAVVGELRRRMPAARLLLLGVFPRAHAADDPFRRDVAAVNAELAPLADGDRIRYLDIGPKFLAPDGTLSPEIMPDYLHPNPRGYEIWGEAIQAEVARMMAPG